LFVVTLDVRTFNTIHQREDVELDKRRMVDTLDTLCPELSQNIEQGSKHSPVMTMGYKGWGVTLD
jgi:hypothetical protein